MVPLWLIFVFMLYLIPSLTLQTRLPAQFFCLRRRSPPKAMMPHSLLDQTLPIILSTVIEPAHRFLPSAKVAFDWTTYTLNFCLICRTVLSWYPTKDIGKLLYSLVVFPTEVFLRPVRKLIPPAFGVDISAIVCIMIISFAQEVLSGPQGILVTLAK
jgi:YggT family protein